MTIHGKVLGITATAGLAAALALPASAQTTTPPANPPATTTTNCVTTGTAPAGNANTTVTTNTNGTTTTTTSGTSSATCPATTMPTTTTMPSGNGPGGSQMDALNNNPNGAGWLQKFNRAVPTTNTYGTMPHHKSKHHAKRASGGGM